MEYLREQIEKRDAAERKQAARNHAYKLLLAYTLTQQHYWMGREEEWMKILSDHGWNGNRSTVLAAMGDLQSRALEAAKEAGV